MSIGKIIAAVMILVVLMVFGNAVFGWVGAVATLIIAKASAHGGSGGGGGSGG